MKVLRNILKCPHCHEENTMTENEDVLLCGKCKSEFAVDRGIPVLLDPNRSTGLLKNYEDNKGKSWAELSPENQYELRRRTVKTRWTLLDKILNFLRYPYVPTPARPSYIDLHEKYMQEGLLALNLSGGSTSPALDGWVNMDILDYETVSVVGDALNVPLSSNTFQLIVCNSVLEHIDGYEKVIAECFRLLRPGGYLYVCVPQVCGQHHKIDYRRWTMLGLLYDMASFDLVEHGFRNGPAVFLPILLETIIEASRLPRILKEVARTAVLWGCLPLRLTDRIAGNRELLNNYAHTIYVLGRKEMAGTSQDTEAADGLFAAEYMNYWKDRVGNASDGTKIADDKVQERYVSLMNIKAEDRVLDLGCSYGRLWDLLGRYTRNVFGVDVSYDVVNEASQKPYTAVVRGKAEDTAFPAGFFDKVVSWAVFDVVDQCKALCEAYRILKPGGKLLFTGKNANYCQDDDIALIAERNARLKGFPNHFTDVYGLLDKLGVFGFRVCQAFAFVRRGDFGENKSVDILMDRPKHFYEFLLIIERLSEDTCPVADIGICSSESIVALSFAKEKGFKDVEEYFLSHKTEEESSQ